MEKIKEYKAICVYGSNELNEKVNDAIKEGWQPFGNISSCHIEVTIGTKVGGGLMLSQAMVKY